MNRRQEIDTQISELSEKLIEVHKEYPILIALISHLTLIINLVTNLMPRSTFLVAINAFYKGVYAATVQDGEQN